LQQLVLKIQCRGTFGPISCTEIIGFPTHQDYVSKASRACPVISIRFGLSRNLRHRLLGSCSRNDVALREEMPEWVLLRFEMLPTAWSRTIVPNRCSQAPPPQLDLSNQIEMFVVPLRRRASNLGQVTLWPTLRELHSPPAWFFSVFSPIPGMPESCCRSHVDSSLLICDHDACVSPSSRSI
jgi:hypothetical protein